MGHITVDVDPLWTLQSQTLPEIKHTAYHCSTKMSTNLTVASVRLRAVGLQPQSDYGICMTLTH